MNRALCELGEAKPSFYRYIPVCQFYGMEGSSHVDSIILFKISSHLPDTAALL